MEESHRKLVLDLALVLYSPAFGENMMALFRAGMKQRKNPLTTLVEGGKKTFKIKEV